MKKNSLKRNGINDNDLKGIKRSLQQDTQILVMCDLGKWHKGE